MRLLLQAHRWLVQSVLGVTASRGHIWVTALYLKGLPHQRNDWVVRHPLALSWPNLPSPRVKLVSIPTLPSLAALWLTLPAIFDLCHAFTMLSPCTVPLHLSLLLFPSAVATFAGPFKLAWSLGTVAKDGWECCSQPIVGSSEEEGELWLVLMHWSGCAGAGWSSSLCLTCVDQAWRRWICPWPLPVPIQICLYYIGAALWDVQVAWHVTHAASNVCVTKHAPVNRDFSWHTYACRHPKGSMVFLLSSSCHPRHVLLLVP